MPYNLEIKDLGLAPYSQVWASMREYTDTRDDETPDALWLVEHPPVYTQGQAGKAEHVLAPGDIPIIQSDRGGQVTYHGPGQLVVYLLIDIKRKHLGIKALIFHIEQAIINMLADYGVQADRKDNAPGIYVEGAKIASLGLRVRKGCTYHGLALNVAMDLTPFSRINPCGYADLKMTQTAALSPLRTLEDAKKALIPHLLMQLGYNERII